MKNTGRANRRTDPRQFSQPFKSSWDSNWSQEKDRWRSWWWNTRKGFQPKTSEVFDLKPTRRGSPCLHWCSWRPCGFARDSSSRPLTIRVMPSLISAALKLISRPRRLSAKPQIGEKLLFVNRREDFDRL